VLLLSALNSPLNTFRRRRLHSPFRCGILLPTTSAVVSVERGLEQDFFLTVLGSKSYYWSCNFFNNVSVNPVFSPSRMTPPFPFKWGDRLSPGTLLKVVNLLPSVLAARASFRSCLLDLPLFSLARRCVSNCPPFFAFVELLFPAFNCFSACISNLFSSCRVDDPS